MSPRKVTASANSSRVMRTFGSGIGTTRGDGPSILHDENFVVPLHILEDVIQVDLARCDDFRHAAMLPRNHAPPPRRPGVSTRASSSANCAAWAGGRAAVVTRMAGGVAMR